MTTAIGRDHLEAVAQRVFGRRVASVTPLPPGSGNIPFLVTLDDDEGRYVFRFNKGFRDDVYDSEAQNYRLIGDATGVRVPRIFAIDRTLTDAPVAYMVLEFLEGTSERDTLDTSARRRARHETGLFYRALHNVTRPAPADESIRMLVLGISALEDAVDAGHIAADVDEIRSCVEVVRSDDRIRTDVLSLCLTDGELLFRPDGTIAFVCDVEWVEFGHALRDLAFRAHPERWITEIDEPFGLEAAALARDPFFRAYGDVDLDGVRRMAVYTQLSTWGFVAAEGAEPEKRRWLRETKGPLIDRLLETVSSGL